ncbi:MAG: alanine racemase [Actinomycetota bacterium]|nr:alanine racemase [Actinomycetota bacterium]
MTGERSRSVPEDTPYLLIDAAKMGRNVRKMAEVAERNGVALRPHVKTHKIPDIAKNQLQTGAEGITVAKLSEAEVMADAGIEDIFIAYPLMTEAKIGRAARLGRRVRLVVGVDSLEGASRLSAVAKAEGQVLEVRLEVDTGLRRTGVPYDKAVELAHAIGSLGNLSLTGIYTYRGAVLGGSRTRELEKAGHEEGRLMVSLAHRMREQGIEVDDVSLGSTPTVEYAAQVEGVTEVRPGTYVFYDRMQVHLGACSIDECAATVVCTVVSRPSVDLAVIDGGSKTFATDVPPGAEPLNLEGFGHVVGYPNVVLDRLTEEHGMLSVDEDFDLEVGDTLRVIPNHICSTVNLHDYVYLLDEGGIVQEVRVAARGKVR